MEGVCSMVVKRAHKRFEAMGLSPLGYMRVANVKNLSLCRYPLRSGGFYLIS